MMVAYIVISALRVHLSDEANDALKRFPGYVTELRGETVVKVVDRFNPNESHLFLCTSE